jgi:cell division protein FtsB
MNNIVLIIALLVAASWTWGSMQAMQRNYTLQKDLDSKQRQVQLLKLEADTLKFQQNYYKSDEYKELAVRERLGLVFPGEKVLILSPNSDQAKQADAAYDKKTVVATVQSSNFEQWVNFLFGGAYHSLNK